MHRGVTTKKGEVMKSIVALTFATAAAVSAVAAGATPPATSAATPPTAQQQAPAQPGATTDAATKAAPKTGDAVYDSAGEAVGTVESVTVDQFVLATDVGKATLPLASVGHGPNGHTLAVTATELKAAIQKANAGTGGA
jgi:hypothetical protein